LDRVEEMSLMEEGKLRSIDRLVRKQADQAEFVELD
jgi:hypothetical protein